MSEEKIVLTAYNVRTKEKGVEMHDVVISKTSKNAFMAKGNDGKGNPLVTLIGRDKALSAIAQGVAIKGWEDDEGEVKAGPDNIVSQPAPEDFDMDALPTDHDQE